MEGTTYGREVPGSGCGIIAKNESASFPAPGLLDIVLVVLIGLDPRLSSGIIGKNNFD